ncbi:hypothetical protein OC844_007633, partial [Tilletia horrida]
MPARIDEDAIRSRAARRPPPIKDALSRLDDDEGDAELLAMIQDQASHEHTDVTVARQTMLLEMRIKAELFYDLYKELNSRGKFGKLMPAPAYVLDADDVPVLRHRLETFLSFLRQTATGRHGVGRPARGTIVTYAHTTLTLVRSYLLKDCSA